MGLCNLPRVSEIVNDRKNTVLLYKNLLANSTITYPTLHPAQSNNYSYFPVVFSSEETLLIVRKKLLENAINTRRYFYPSLNNMPFLQLKSSCPISENIAKRVLCLPLYFNIGSYNVERICKIVNSVL